MKREAYQLMEELSETYWWYRARGEIIEATVRRFVPSGATVLDFGCGAGQISLRLQAIGYDVVSADTDREILSVCEQRGLSVIDLNDNWPAPASQQAVLACDVLEHVDDDVALLQKLQAVLEPGGVVLVTVPAYEFLWSGEDHVSGHVRRYRRSLLNRRLRQAGFQLVWSSYFNSILLPLITATIVAKRIFWPRDMYRTDVQPLPTWINESLYRVFRSERWLLRHTGLPAGASILTVARRDDAS